MSTKRKVLTVIEKVAIIKDKESGAKNKAICKKYGLSSSTVSTLLKNREPLLRAYERNITAAKRLKKCDKADLDEVLYRWYIFQKNAGLPTNCTTMRKQAQIFAVQLGYENFTCSNGWLHRFRLRHNIFSLKKNGETVLESVLEPSTHSDSGQSLPKVKIEKEESDSETSLLSNSTGKFGQSKENALNSLSLCANELKTNGRNLDEISENADMENTLFIPAVSISENNIQELNTFDHNEKTIVECEKEGPLNSSLPSFTTYRKEKETAPVDCHIETEMLLDVVKQENETVNAKTQLLPLHFYAMATQCVDTLQCFFESIDQKDEEVFNALRVIHHKLSDVKHSNKTSSDNR